MLEELKEEDRADLCFFLSSGRRHTRWPRDWSSDVCSSDLGTTTAQTTCPERTRSTSRAPRQGGFAHSRQGRRRSEERRVGKKRGSRGSPARQSAKQGVATATRLISELPRQMMNDGSLPT